MDTLVREQTTSPWRALAVRTACAEVGLLAVAAIALQDLEAAALTLGGVVALVLLRLRTGLLGLLGIGLLSADVAAWMGPGTFSNITHEEGFWEVALPGLLTVASVTALAAVVGELIHRRTGARGRSARALTVFAALAAVAVLVLGAVGGIGSATEPLPSDIQLVTENVKFSQERPSTEAGEVGVFVSNKDLFWHTFTIKDMDVNLNIPVGGERRITFQAAAGTYEFVCAIPGHAGAGMKGTLTVR